jgi:hypothetical protein
VIMCAKDKGERRTEAARRRAYWRRPERRPCALTVCLARSGRGLGTRTLANAVLDSIQGGYRRAQGGAG